MKKFTVIYELPDEMHEELKSILPKWQQTQGKRGGYPFANFTEEQLFHLIMFTGSIPEIKCKMHSFCVLAGIKMEASA